MIEDLKWIFRRNRMLFLVAGVTLLAGLLVKPALWNMLTTVWGTFVGGVLAWIWFQVRGPALERAVWLKSNGNLISRQLNTLCKQADATIYGVLGSYLPPNLTFLDQRIEAVESRKSSVTQGTSFDANWVLFARLTFPVVKQAYQAIGSTSSHTYLTGLTDLQVIVHNYCESYRLYEACFTDKAESAALPGCAILLVFSSLDLFAAVSRILAEAELLPYSTSTAPGT